MDQETIVLALVLGAACGVALLAGLCVLFERGLKVKRLRRAAAIGEEAAIRDLWVLYGEKPPDAPEWWGRT